MVYNIHMQREYRKIVIVVKDDKLFKGSHLHISALI